MKAFLRFFYIAIVAIVVFTGALYIAEGMRASAPTAQQEEAMQPGEAAPLPDFLDSGEGSAL
ncbi:MAG: hypothetical protein ACI4PG_04450 [Candidatus Ventricola sp.]